MEGEDGLAHLDSIFCSSFVQERMQNYPILFIIGVPQSHDKILSKMKQRKNNLDILKKEYVTAQYEVFSHLKNYDFPHFYFLDLEEEELYTPIATQKMELSVNAIFHLFKQPRSSVLEPREKEAHKIEN